MVQIRVALATACAWAVATAAAAAGDPAPAAKPVGAEAVGAFKEKVAKWVETRRILSEESSGWEQERQTLEASRDLLRQEKKNLEADIAELDESSTAADDERGKLILDRDEFQQASAVLEKQIREMEEQVLALAPRLPEPLRHKLEPLLVQIPDDPERTRVQLGQRLMNVLGVLAQAEKWNGTATMVGETRAVGEGGQKVAVRTLYWGLGQAIYVDAQGDVAGIGRPGPDGWQFVDDPDITDDAKLLLDIYEGNNDAIEFVSMPVSVSTH